MSRKITARCRKILAAICLVSFSACTNCRKGDSRVAIVSASYGVADRRVDVTEAVRSLETRGAVCLRAPWALGEVDPAFGTMKDVKIIYRAGGTRKTAIFTQRQDIVLPIPAGARTGGGEGDAGIIAPAGGGKSDYHSWLSERGVAPTLVSGMKYEFRSWHQGQPAVRLIRMEDGFCALTRVTGHFQGGGEVVQLYIGPDGYWYLGGHSMQEGVAAQCIVVHY